MKKVRIDKLLFDREMVSSRHKAQALIMAGCVLVNEVPATKPGQLIDPDAVLRLRGKDHPYVGRGGVKLAKALESFACDCAGKVCIDVGASTGGFTDCLLQQGAKRVFAIDVGYGQLDPKIAKDPRVIVLDRQNIRSLKQDKISEPIELAVIDVSFISLSLVFPAVDLLLNECAEVIALIKPQFEVGPERIGKGGIVRDPEAHLLAIRKVEAAGEALGWSVQGVIDSPITGAKGNQEFLIHFRKGMGV